MPDAGVLATILLIVGLFLLALELMIPSFGIIGILAAISLLISAWCAWQAWWGSSPGFFWTYAAFWLLGIPSVLGGVLYLLQNSRRGDHIVLKGPPAAAPPAVNESGSLIGQHGQAASSLMPGGMVMLNDERFHAETRGMLIEAGERVEVIGMEGNRLIVKRASDVPTAASPVLPATPPAEQGRDESLAATQLLDQPKSADSDGSLDFDIPEDYTAS